MILLLCERYCSIESWKRDKTWLSIYDSCRTIVGYYLLIITIKSLEYLNFTKLLNNGTCYLEGNTPTIVQIHMETLATVEEWIPRVTVYFDSQCIYRLAAGWLLQICTVMRMNRTFAEIWMSYTCWFTDDWMGHITGVGTWSCGCDLVMISLRSRCGVDMIPEWVWMHVWLMIVYGRDHSILRVASWLADGCFDLLGCGLGLKSGVVSILTIIRRCMIFCMIVSYVPGFWRLQVYYRWIGLAGLHAWENSIYCLINILSELIFIRFWLWYNVEHSVKHNTST